jgi:predicted RNA-binding Zn ribbon-like protein
MDTDLPFEFVGGHPALDFVNTVAWGEAGLSEERFTSHSRFIDWVEAARLPFTVAALRQRTRGDQAASKLMKQVRDARAEIHDLCWKKNQGSLDARSLADFNGRLAQALRYVRIGFSQSNVLDLQWVPGRQGELLAPLHWIIWEAANLFASNTTIKFCANDNCGWAFLDSSRRGNRRWCDMAVCGSRHKARQYYYRTKAVRGSG